MSAFFCYTDFELCLLGRVPDFTRKGGAEGVRYRPIRRNSEYGRVYARGKSYVNPALVLYVLKTRGKKTRVGLTATKKIGHAVQRNRARRVMKAAIDEHLDYNIGGYDLVFVARDDKFFMRRTHRPQFGASQEANLSVSLYPPGRAG